MMATATTTSREPFHKEVQYHLALSILIFPPATKEDKLNDEKLKKSLADETRSNWLASRFDPGLSHDSNVVLVNDKFPEVECVYAISSSKSQKRVTVTFRGTVNLSNWIVNLRAQLIDRPNPVQTDYPDREDTIEIHTGFSEYLLRKRLDNGKTKFDEIAQSVHDTANQLGGNCQVFLTGHSLGGSLATIFGFYASADPRFASKEHPIKVFTFASPYTGGRSFAKAFRHQEQAGLLLHARVHHEYDVVPQAAKLSGAECFHTGLGVKLHYDTKQRPTLFFVMDFCHKGFLRRLFNFFLFHLPWFQLGNLGFFHLLQSYNESLLASVGANSKATQGADIQKKSLEELYEEYGSTGLAENGQLFNISNHESRNTN